MEHKLIADQELIMEVLNDDKLSFDKLDEFDELSSAKAWLFKENVRIESEKSRLEKERKKLESERERFREEMKLLNDQFVSDRKRIRQEEEHIKKELEILKKGFKSLEEDRIAQRKAAAKQPVMENDAVNMLFKGVNSYLTLKKRYKDLVKMFHPDSIAGDNDMILMINKVYEKKKREYEMEMRA